MLQLFSRFKVMSVFITGVTGYVGKHLLYYFLKESDRRLTVCIRNKKGESAQDRFRKEIQEHPLFQEAVVKANVSRVSLIEKDVNHLQESDLSGCSDIIHCAANVKFTSPMEELLKENVDGCKKIHSLCKEKRFYHISTCYVHPVKSEGHRASVAIQPNLQSHDFICNYAYTKYLAEQYLQSQAGSIDIIRLSCVGAPLEQLAPIRGGAHLAICEAVSRASIPDLWLPDHFLFSVVPVDSICKGILERTKHPHDGLQIVQYSAPETSKTYNLTPESLMKYRKTIDINIWTELSYEEFCSWIDFFYWFLPSSRQKIKDVNAVISYVQSNITFVSDLSLPELEEGSYAKLTLDYIDRLIEAKPRNQSLFYTFFVSIYRVICQILVMFFGLSLTQIFKHQKETSKNPLILLSLQIYSFCKTIFSYFSPTVIEI
jgi:nucleoside-diphosphate-sugar epimerase